MDFSKILIVGGGTAGWMSACLMAKRWQKLGVSITLVESPNVPTIGVGEGSTPFLKDFFETMGISETTWMPECDATYKCGIDFPGWCRSNKAESYFHPFYAQADSEFVGDFFASCQQRREGFDTPTSPDDYFISAYLAKQNKAPVAYSEAPTGLEYGYHFDAAKLGIFLAKHAARLGVTHLQDDVLAVNTSTDLSNDMAQKSNAEKRITSIETASHGLLKADLYIDCSGLKGMLIQQTLGEPMHDYSAYLVNNRAVAISLELNAEDKRDDIGSFTNSKAMKNGWMWNIPLQTRMGNGYVFSDKYLSTEQAEKELREHLQEFTAPALHLSWQPGRIEQHWRANCLAIGMSQGFLEPLEAPMLNLVQQTCESFIEHAEQGQSEHIKVQFNQSINGLIDGTRDYLQAHYLLNTRQDSEYWADLRSNLSVSQVLKDIIDAWDSQGTFESALAKHGGKLAYGKTSWYCILAGMERFSEANRAPLRVSHKKHRRAKQACQAKADMFNDQFKVLKNTITEGVF